MSEYNYVIELWGVDKHSGIQDAGREGRGVTYMYFIKSI